METGIRPPIQMAVDSMRNLCLGYTGEQNAQLIQIDVSKWQEKWPGASIDLMLALPGEKASYPAKTELQDGKLLFLPGYGDTQKPGHGAAYVVATKDGTHLAASDTVLTEIMHKGRGGDDLPEAPEAQAGWVADVLDAAHRAEEAAERAENAQVTDEQVGKAVDDYLRENPVEVPVKSVNGQTGEVQLSAADVGALPQDTPIPAPYTLPTASADVKGGVKVGKGLRMDGDAMEAEVQKEDIDKLSEEIEELKSSIGDGEQGEPEIAVPPEIVWEQGSVDKNTGEELVSNTRIRTNYISLANVRSISVSVKSGYQYVLDCYSADKAIVAVEELETGSWVSLAKTLVFPSGIAYVRFLLCNKGGAANIVPEESSNITFAFEMSGSEQNDYSAEIEATVKAVQTIMASSAEPMLTMAVFTDLHAENAAQAVYPANDMFSCISALNERLNFDAVWNLGDMVDGQYYTQYKNEGYLADIVGRMREICAASYVVPGNHDDNEQATRDQYAGLDASERMTVLEMHNAVQKFSPGIHCNPERYTDFYVDFEEYGIRAICVTADYTTFTTQTRDWLSSTALDTQNAVLVMAHQATKGKWGFNHDVVNGDYIETALSAFVSRGGTIIGYIHGHTHGDMIETDESISWTEIAIGCAKFETLTSGTEGIAYQPRNANDYTKVLFDVVCVDKTNQKLHFVRCGAGADRAVTY